MDGRDCVGYSRDGEDDVGGSTSGIDYMVVVTVGCFRDGGH